MSIGEIGGAGALIVAVLGAVFAYLRTARLDERMKERSEGLKDEVARVKIEYLEASDKRQWEALDKWDTKITEIHTAVSVIKARVEALSRPNSHERPSS